MLIPVRCFSCGRMIANKWAPYTELLKNGYTVAEALEKLGIMRFCCRRMFITHADLIDKMIEYSHPEIPDEQFGE